MPSLREFALLLTLPFYQRFPDLMKRPKHEAQGPDFLVEAEATKPFNRPRARKGGLSLLPTVNLDILFEASPLLRYISIPLFIPTDLRLSETPRSPQFSPYLQGLSELAHAQIERFHLEGLSCPCP